MQLRDMLLALAPLDKDWVVQVGGWSGLVWSGLIWSGLGWGMLACTANAAGEHGEVACSRHTGQQAPGASGALRQCADPAPRA